MADDRVRLARAFGIEPLPLALTVVGATGLALLGLASLVGLVPSAALAAMLAVEQRKIAVGLREVERWDFPVEGYRDWLLALHPTFEVELRAEVGSELVEQALAAVDPEIAVERRGPRIVRVVTPRVRIRSEETGYEVVVGDRRLLAAIRERVLAPIHADVGIVAMRMGDRHALAGGGALVPAGDPDLGTAFRDQAMAAPPALQALVRAGTAQLRPSNEARHRQLHDDRVLHAAGKQPTNPMLVAGLTLGGVIAGGMALGAVGGIAGLAVALAGGVFGVLRIDRRRAQVVARSLDGRGFPIEGYDDWLISARPVIDVELCADPGRDRVAVALRGVAHELTWLDDTLLRIETAPRQVTPSGNAIPPFWGGDPAVLAALFRQLLRPLHAEVGIVAMRMGGFVDRRE